MRPHVRAKVEKNCEYHEALAAQYEQLMHKAEASGAKESAAQAAPARGSAAQAAPAKGDAAQADPKLQHLFDLHTEVAKQLRELLAADAPPAIQQALASRTVRRSDVGMIPEPRFAAPPRRAPVRSARVH